MPSGAGGIRTNHLPRRRLCGPQRRPTSGSDPRSDGRSEDEALWRRRRPKAGVAPDLATTPPAATARFDALVKTHVTNDITNTAAEGRAEI